MLRFFKVLIWVIFLVGPLALAQRNFNNRIDWNKRITLAPGGRVSLFSHLNFGYGRSGECNLALNRVRMNIAKANIGQDRVALYSNSRRLESSNRVEPTIHVYDFPVVNNRKFCRELRDLTLVNEGIDEIVVNRVSFDFDDDFYFPVSPPFSSSEFVTCQSYYNRYVECAVSSLGQSFDVTLVQPSDTSGECLKGETYGLTRYGSMWVDRNCGGTFEILTK